MQHARHLVIDQVDVLRAHFRRDVEARHGLPDELVVRRALRQGLAGKLDLEPLPADEIRIRNRPLRRALDANHALDDLEALEGRTQMLRTHRDQRLPGFGGSTAKRRDALNDAVARARASLVGCGRGVAHPQLHAIERHVELLGDDLAKRRADAHARLDLAHGCRHAPIGIHRKPRVEAIGSDLRRPRTRAGRGGARGAARHRRRERDDERPGALQELASRENAAIHAHGGLRHLRPSSWLRASPRATRSCAHRNDTSSRSSPDASPTRSSWDCARARRRPS